MQKKFQLRSSAPPLQELYECGYNGMTRQQIADFCSMRLSEIDRLIDSDDSVKAAIAKGKADRYDYLQKKRNKMLKKKGVPYAIKEKIISDELTKVHGWGSNAGSGNSNTYNAPVININYIGELPVNEETENNGLATQKYNDSIDVSAKVDSAIPEARKSTFHDDGLD